LPPWEVSVRSEIPLARGLGSSASAVVGGLAAANQVLAAGWEHSDLLRLATEIEGHPDNVAPALYGGLCVAVSGAAGPVCAPVPVADPPAWVVAIPGFELSTAKARAALPAVVSLQDAVYNVGRAALLTAALVSGRHELLIEALSDRLHEPYRQTLVPGMPEVVSAAKEAGAYGVTLSGAGPTLLAWCSSEHQEAVAHRMAASWREAGVEARAIAVGLGRRGMTIGPALGAARG
ncbi:MAG TPA: homoserine kinase, partial [Stenomitos sp.]